MATEIEEYKKQHKGALEEIARLKDRERRWLERDAFDLSQNPKWYEDRKVTPLPFNDPRRFRVSKSIDYSVLPEVMALIETYEAYKRTIPPGY